MLLLVEYASTCGDYVAVLFQVIRVLPDLQERAPVMFENLRLLRLTAENKYREKVMRIESAMRLFEGFTCDVVICDGSKVRFRGAYDACKNCHICYISWDFYFLFLTLLIM